MTMICALYNDKAIYMAADSMLSGLPVKQKTNRKIETVKNPPIAWATGGDEAIGDLFGIALRKMLEKEKQNLTWDIIMGWCLDILPHYNGMIRRARNQSGSGVVLERDLAEVLLAGFIGEQPNIVHISQEGDIDLPLQSGRKFIAIGGARFHASMAYKILASGRETTNTHEMIREVAIATTTHAPNCDFPVHIACITENYVEVKSYDKES